MPSLSILILSCDKNIELLDNFFNYFETFWEDCQYPIYVSMENENYKNRNVEKVFNYSKNNNWGERIIEALKIINSQNVLIILDDFFLEEKVNAKLIEDINILLNENKKITNFILTETREDNYEDKIVLNAFVERKRFGRYKAVFQIGIWNRVHLISLLDPKENAWEFEIFGNIRSFLNDNKFYSLINNDKKPIVYNDGFLVVQGTLNLKEKERLELKTGIKITNTILPEYYGVKNRDNISFIKKVLRRLKIIRRYSKTRIKVLLKESELLR